MRKLVFIIVSIWLGTAFAYKANAATIVNNAADACTQAMNDTPQVVGLLGTNRIVYDQGDRLQVYSLFAESTPRIDFTNMTYFRISEVNDDMVTGFIVESSEQYVNLTRKASLRVSPPMALHLSRMIEEKESQLTMIHVLTR